MEAQNAWLGTAVIMGAAWLGGIPATVGKKKQPISPVTTLTGMALYGLALSFISQAQPKIAGQLATLVLVATTLLYAVPVAKKFGLMK